MSRQATKINITEEQRTALENGYRNGATHSFRMRCLMVLGKAYGLSNAAAGARAGQTYQRVMHWVKRFQSDGIAGLRNRPGNGRRRIISTRKDRGLHIFYLPPYSPHLNIAETLWRVLKGKWIQPHHYGNKHGLFSTVEDILSNVGKQYMINFCRPAA